VRNKLAIHVCPEPGCAVTGRAGNRCPREGHGAELVRMVFVHESVSEAQKLRETADRLKETAEKIQPGSSVSRAFDKLFADLDRAFGKPPGR
jgi:hypothetical protein